LEGTGKLPGPNFVSHCKEPLARNAKIEKTPNEAVVIEPQVVVPDIASFGNEIISGCNRADLPQNSKVSGEKIRSQFQNKPGDDQRSSMQDLEKGGSLEIILRAFVVVAKT
jgi:hypothetical protein